MTEQQHRISLHLVSDATGETLNSIARATVAQFEHAAVVYHRWNLIRSRIHLRRVLEGIADDPGPVLASIMDRTLRGEFDAGCARLGVQLMHPLDPVLSVLQDRIGETAVGRPGKQYVLDEEYYRRIEAMHYVLAHDDGQATAGLADADVVLVGVSRASKTPTAFYLANRGVKAANVPLVPGIAPPQDLLAVQRPVIGLTIDPATLIEIRRNRLRLIAPRTDRPAALEERDNTYVDPEVVRAEVQWARRLCLGHGWPVVDVSRRSIEETAAAVIELSSHWAARHPDLAGNAGAP